MSNGKIENGKTEGRAGRRFTFSPVASGVARSPGFSWGVGSGEVGSHRAVTVRGHRVRRGGTRLEGAGHRALKV
ncbi:hypothetical protein NL676_009627 [Syzygium grande]|nr:hypothetical protein NL676_009627 [Syzygium grande]